MISNDKDNPPKSEIDTGGGGFVDGNVQSDKDFIGRDKIENSNLGSVRIENVIYASEPQKQENEPVVRQNHSKGGIDRTQVWVAIIAAVPLLIAAYWQFVWKPSQQPLSPKQLDYIGHVIDNKTSTSIRGAKIIFEFQGAPPIVYTDSEGTYRFTIDVQGDKIAGRVRVEANGYENYDRNITLVSNNPGIEDIRLSPINELSDSPSAVSMPTKETSVTQPIDQKPSYKGLPPCDSPTQEYKDMLTIENFDGYGDIGLPAGHTFPSGITLSKVDGITGGSFDVFIFDCSSGGGFFGVGCQDIYTLFPSGHASIGKANWGVVEFEFPRNVSWVEARIAETVFSGTAMIARAYDEKGTLLFERTLCGADRNTWPNNRLSVEGNGIKRVEFFSFGNSSFLLDKLAWK